MRYQLLEPFALVALLVTCAAGCNATSSISGEVTYEGKPIEGGTIIFMPADGKGVAASAEIEDGRYSAKDVAPGPKVVQIIATKQVKFARTNEEMAAEFAARKDKGKKASAPESALAIPQDAVGNNQRVEVAPGKQSMNFTLTKPAKK